MDKVLSNKITLLELLRNGCSQNDIAALASRSADTVHSALRYHDIDLRKEKLNALRRKRKEKLDRCVNRMSASEKD
ncbi:MAG TPA: hypothetical protein O0W90_02960 [Methanocorpusculum sp.]|nr:hypothetical protein [Methanocorpusculum sp.]